MTRGLGPSREELSCLIKEGVRGGSNLEQLAVYSLLLKKRDKFETIIK